MMKWFIGVSGTIALGAIGWMTTFITMGYQAQADIQDLKHSFVETRRDQSDLKAELRAVKEISLRTEDNTEKIRTYLLQKAIK
jgi:hypothetical protein